MHLKRWITSIVALPLLLAVVLKGGVFLFAVLVAVVSLISLKEYYQIVWGAETKLLEDPLAMLGFAASPILIWSAYRGSFKAMMLLTTLNLMGAGWISLRQFRTDTRAFERLSKQVCGFIYIPVFLSFLILIRMSEAGICWIFFLITLIFLNDIGAFYVGTFLGRHKLCPAVSPNKTIEGSLGGLVAALTAGTVFKLYVLPAMPWDRAFMLFILIAAAGQTGDLFESECKRYAGVKDSGRILPGHGGLLDRIDALLFAAPVLYWYLEYIL